MAMKRTGQMVNSCSLLTPSSSDAWRGTCRWLAGEELENSSQGDGASSGAGPPGPGAGRCSTRGAGGLVPLPADGEGLPAGIQGGDRARRGNIRSRHFARGNEPKKEK